MKTVKKYISRFLVRLGKRFGGDEVQEVSLYQLEPQQAIKEEKPPIVDAKEEVILQTEPKIIEQESILEPENKENQLIPEKQTKKKTNLRRKKSTLPKLSIDPRDIMEIMGVPYLALSKNRKLPIVYTSPDGTIKVRISCHSEHYIASIYDWDIIQCIAGKVQEFINSKTDIPPRTMIISRNELIKALHKHGGKKQHKDLEASLNRLQTTLIETTVRNEDYRYRSGFSFLDNWRYSEREDIKEFRITLSEWLYDGICKEGALLKVCYEYFDITSGLKKIFYRIARKHVGTKNKSWDFSLENLYEKSGSEQKFKQFKYNVRKLVKDNDLPDYSIEWIEEGEKITVRFINIKQTSRLTEPDLPKPQSIPKSARELRPLGGWITDILQKNN